MADGAQEKVDTTQQASSPERILSIIVKNVMEGKPQVTVKVPASSQVKELKLAISDACEVQPSKQLLLYKDNELKDDEVLLSHYGIVDDCTITMNVKMNTGVSRASSGGVDLIFYVPASMPSGNITSLRTVIKGMNNAKGRPKKVAKAVDKNKNTQVWTAEKQLEHELTRNRMKKLLKKKKRTNILSDTPGGSNNGSQSASVIGSRASYSPVATPPTELASGIPASREPTPTPTSPEVKEVTEKELKLYFEPAESLQQLLSMRRDMYTPPQNQKELDELKLRLANLEKTRCGMCKKKLPLSEQTMACLCKKVFCRKHRNPEQHLCVIDYKQTGRSKLVKENPKIGGEGIRKAKC